ncbi:hypothetical protein J1N35_034829 [Gossypium stocksii]|uniref:Uncharacterized protein n=1 Tax=Gossypium stocksii TaxID=47602 RepID=A0A9D3UUN5_9ROSI|nr:hypothetical protein J1N35_034829 [Gossypium stocksii]
MEFIKGPFFVSKQRARCVEFAASNTSQYLVGIHLSFSLFSPFIVEICTAPVDDSIHLPLSKVAGVAVIFEVQRSSRLEARKEEQRKQELDVFVYL